MQTSILDDIVFKRNFAFNTPSNSRQFQGLRLSGVCVESKRFTGGSVGKDTGVSVIRSKTGQCDRSILSQKGSGDNLILKRDICIIL